MIAGSVGLTGAAAMAAESALRSGAGAVILATPRDVYPVLSRKLTEVVIKPLPSAGGALTGEAAAALEREVAWADVIVAGPGMGRTAGTGEFLERILTGSIVTGKRHSARTKRNILLDADALRLIADEDRIARALRKHRTVLTPHEGEFAALQGTGRFDERARLTGPALLAARLGSTVVLKGSPTVTAHPDGRVCINSTGNPGMATIGAGDVLTGLIAGLWAQGAAAAPDPDDETMMNAVLAGVFLHGAAGDLAASKLGIRGMIAGDILSEIPEALESLKDGEIG
jgi:NAD(P)H-hydrate epimerase